ncbi:MAG TPA: hypothetical protein VER12_08155 [Polyangiaceae bacterium]|nr:hypothetical protein [Polyangiaceae bacterium]
MRLISSSSLFLALLIPLLQSVARPASAAEPDKAWRVAYDRCQKLSSDGDYTAALAACEQAYTLNPDPGILAYIAQIQTALLHPVQALDALQRYLRSDSLDPADRKTAEAQVRYLETQIGTLALVIRVEAGRVGVDGHWLDAASVAQGVRLAAGAHQVTLEAEGETFSRFVWVRGGEKTLLDLPGSGSIAMSCATPEMRFFIDDQELSPTEASHGVSRAVGSHRVGFKAGSSVWPTETVRVKPDELISVICSPRLDVHAGADRPSMNQRGYWVTGAGLSLGIAALATAIYNGNEYDRWQAANDDLAKKMDQMTFADSQRQARDNDELIADIKTRRKVSIGLGIASGLVTAAGVALVFSDSAAKERHDASSWLRKMAAGLGVNGAKNSAEVAWRGAW